MAITNIKNVIFFSGHSTSNLWGLSHQVVLWGTSIWDVLIINVLFEDMSISTHSFLSDSSLYVPESPYRYCQAMQ